MGTSEFNAVGQPCNGLASRPGGVEIPLVALCYGNQDKLRPDRPLGSDVDFIFTFLLTLFNSSPAQVSREKN